MAGSLLIALLTAALALAGLLAGDAVYQSQELRASFVTNDLVNLVIGVPILLIARAQLAVYVADFATIPAWIIGGALL